MSELVTIDQFRLAAVLAAELEELHIELDWEPPASEKLIVPLPQWVADERVADEMMDWFASHLTNVPRAALFPGSQSLLFPRVL